MRKNGIKRFRVDQSVSFLLLVAFLVSIGGRVHCQSVRAMTTQKNASTLAMGSINKQTYQEKLREAEEKKKAYEKKKKETEENIRLLETKKEDILTYIEELDAQLTKIAKELSELEDSIAVTNKELEVTRSELQEAKETEAKQYETMKHRIQYLYENGSEDLADVFITSGSIVDFLNQVEYAKKISEYDNNLLNDYIKTKELIEEKEQYLAAQLSALKVQEDQKTYDQNTLTSLSNEKAKEVASYTKQISEKGELLADYGDEIAYTEANIKKIKQEEIKRQQEEKRRREEEARRKKEEESKRQNATTTVTSDATSLGSMIWPLPGDGRIYAYFGPRKAPIAGASTFHKGLDIGGAMGASIVASLAGKVTAAGYSISGGNYVEVDHGDGVATRYLHCSRLLVSTGQYVKQGQVIAKVGSTGISTGPHLHFTLKLNGIPVDPLKYVSFGG